MDEMTLLRGMRSGIASPPPATLARHRRKVLAGIGVVSSVDTAVVAPPRAAGRGKARRRITLLAAAAAFLVGVLVTADVVLPDRGRATAEATQLLDDVEAAAMSTADPVLLPGQYLKIEREELLSNTFAADGVVLSWDALSRDQLYVPSDLEGEWVWNREAQVPADSAPEVVKELARNRAVNDPRTEAAMVGVFRAPGGDFDGAGYTILGVPPADTSGLPRDPAKLLDRIYEYTKDRGTPDDKAFEMVKEILRTGVIPSDLRVALYRAAALIPGVDAVGSVVMADGREGVALGMVSLDGIWRSDLVIDPATGLVIGEQVVSLQDYDGAPAGTVSSWRSVRTSVVDSAP
ncbi:CU044_5270 family protein [Arthrobacter sp. zg-Y750]|uniref:CU044_5270 family protein n=1 Tax=Arthrobacter sp. zg-Y750 TaxID=2894189 RepID=UPI001E2BDC0D|nr:CU044_5270 family protein [Arthrobacter sp. zg-Y750]MCC9178740.1 CU044_5270 family protein [Arthrobacter sp. zg-Y750]